MAAAFTAILTAHLLGILLFQAEWMDVRKRRLWLLVLHAAGVTLASCLLLGTLQWQFLSAIFLTQLALDAIHVYWLSGSVAALLIEKSAHLAALFALAFYFRDTANRGWWMTRFGPELPGRYFALLSIISGIILCVPAGGYLIARFTRRFADEIRDTDIAGLKQGGQYIGWLERFLVMLLLLMDQPNGIGFLIAAKSILRFGEIKDPGQRKVTEYIIIGTFLSFAWGLSIAALTQKAIKYWLP